jgi:hypothetical protein
MKNEVPTPVPPDGTSAPPEKAKRSGEGAATALQAMIRKRKQMESPEEPAPPETRPPLP